MVVMDGKKIRNVIRNFLPLLHEGRVSEKSLGVSTLQAAEPLYSVNDGRGLKVHFSTLRFWTRWLMN